MSEIIAPPGDWELHPKKEASDLSNYLAANNHRLISIKSFVENGKRFFSAISVRNEDEITWNWDYQITPKDLDNAVKVEDSRLISLDCYYDGELFCAAVWVKNKEGIFWNWAYDLYPGELKHKLEKEQGKPICLRYYTQPALPEQRPPIAFQENYCAIWVKDDGEPWGFEEKIDFDGLGQKLEDELGRLISIDNLDGIVYSGVSEGYAAVWWRVPPGSVWFWNVGLSAVALKQEFKNFCSYGMDVVPVWPDAYGSIMFQYPKPQDPNAMDLLKATGSGTLNAVNPDLFQDWSTNVKVENISPDSVTLTRIAHLFSSEQGWTWYGANVALNGDFWGHPLTMVAGATYNFNSGWGASNNPKYMMFQIQAQSSAGIFQDLLAQFPISAAGFTPVQPLPLHAPVFLGIQGPVEVIPYTDKIFRCQVTAQIVNATGKAMTIHRVHVRLEDSNGILIYKKDLPLLFTWDQDLDGMPIISPMVDQPFKNVDAPLPKFTHVFDVPRDFKAGIIRVECNVKIGEDCYGDARELPVKLGPKNILLSPVQGTWSWGNGPGASYLHGHSYPEHRYSYDIGKVVNGSQTVAGGDPLDNKTYNCFGQPILAMLDGEVIFLSDTNPDNNGNENPSNPGPANVVVIKSGDIYHLYAHLKQDSAMVSVGDMIAAGKEIGLVGNSGGSSAPHLHVGITRRDSNGFLRSLPMSFKNLQDTNGAAVVGTPKDQTQYKSI
jgi:hypothetical protein